MSLLYTVIILASFAGLAALFLRLQRDLEGCVAKSDARTKANADRPIEFYNAFPDRRSRTTKPAGSHRVAA